MGRVFWKACGVLLRTAVVLGCVSSTASAWTTIAACSSTRRPMPLSLLHGGSKTATAAVMRMTMAPPLPFTVSLSAISSSHSWRRRRPLEQSCWDPLVVITNRNQPQRRTFRLSTVAKHYEGTCAMSKNTINSETSDNNNSPTSSQTIQAMAAFLSLSMTQALLTSNLETPTNKEHRPNDKNEDSATDDDATAVATLEEDTAVSVPLQESGTTLHQKEGDRVLAMQDTFFTEPNSLTPPSSSNTDDVDKEGLDATTALSATKEEVFSAPPRETASEVLQLQRDSSSGDSSIFTATSSSSDLIPAVPGSISLAFGRPLVAFQERVPPLRLENSILSQSSNNHTPIANGSTTAQKQQAQPESGVSAASPKILDAIIIRDNDPYGE